MRPIYRQKTSQAMLTVRAKAEANRREGILERTFPKWCWHGNEGVDYAFMQQVMLGVGKHVKKEKVAEILLKEWQDEVEQVGGPELAEGSSLDNMNCPAFVKFWMQQLEEATPAEFDKFISLVEPIATQVVEQITATRRKRTLWQLFARWDFNGNGTLDFDEIEVVVDKDRPARFPPNKPASELGPGLSLANFQQFVQTDLLKGRADDKEFYKTVGVFLERIEQIRAFEEPARQERRQLVLQAVQEGLDAYAYVDRFPGSGLPEGAKHRQSMEEKSRRYRFKEETNTPAVATIGGLHSEFKSPNVTHAVPRAHSPVSGLQSRSPVRSQPCSPTAWRSPPKTPPRDTNSYQYNPYYRNSSTAINGHRPTTPTSRRSDISPPGSPGSPYQRPATSLGNPIRRSSSNRPASATPQPPRADSAPLRPPSPISRDSPSPPRPASPTSASCTLAGSTTIMRDSASDRLRARNREAREREREASNLNISSIKSPPATPNGPSNVVPTYDQTPPPVRIPAATARLSRPPSSCSVVENPASFTDVATRAAEQDWENFRELREKAMTPVGGGWGWRADGSSSIRRDEVDTELQRQRDKQYARRKERERREMRSSQQRALLGDTEGVGMDTGTGTLKAWNWHKEDRDKQEIHRQTDWHVCKKKAQWSLTHSLGQAERGWGYKVSETPKYQIRDYGTTEGRPVRPASPTSRNSSPVRRTPSPPRQRTRSPIGRSSSPLRTVTPVSRPVSRSRSPLRSASPSSGEYRPVSPPRNVVSASNGNPNNYSLAMLQVRHALDGIRKSDVHQFLQLGMHTKVFPTKLINTILAPVCILLDLSPSAQNDNQEGVYWGVVSGMLHSRTEDFFIMLEALDPRQVTYSQLSNLKRYYIDADFDSCYALPTSRLLSAFVDWCKAVINMTCLHNGWNMQTVFGIDVRPAGSAYTPHPPPQRPVSPSKRASPSRTRSVSPTLTRPTVGTYRRPVSAAGTRNPRKSHYAAKGIAPPYQENARNRGLYFPGDDDAHIVTMCQLNQELDLSNHNANKEFSLRA
eukprot:TRINITY_DN66638_c13_g7_i1.p1 TRINITY_DN66638_c13_g7~~TRINITY_DN66638_c13_g7_i1.p1  ORF type:complete len:1035 (+),score=85.18 TRINITY_DN66638_c13_g7_i1:104-3208(+)